MEDNKFSLINFDGVSEVAIKFLEMIEDTVGWCMKLKGNKRDFEDGLELYKQSIIQDDKLSNIEKAALYAESRRILKCYINQGKIIDQALLYIENDLNIDIDEDWLLLFFDYAKNISNEQIQNVWGKILAEKYKGKESINRRLIYCLYLLDAESCCLFEKLCKWTITLDLGRYWGGFYETNMRESTVNYVPLTFIDYDHIGEFHLLEELGLISIMPDGEKYNFFSNDCYVIIDNKKYLIKHKHINNNSVLFGNVRYTTTGSVLCNILNIPLSNSILDRTKSILMKYGYILETL